MMCSTSRILSFVLSRELTLGMWMIVFQPNPGLYSPASKVATVEAISSTGQVLDRSKVP